MEDDERTEPETPDDERGSERPAEQGGDVEPTPGEDPGPQGNPAQDEEALRHSQEERSEGGAA